MTQLWYCQMLGTIGWEILEFRAESFQRLFAPPRSEEFDSAFQTIKALERAGNRRINRWREVKAEEWVSTTLNVESVNWSSYKGLTVDTLAHRGDEGRGYLRKVSGSWKHALIRESPNGATPRTAT